MVDFDRLTHVNFNGTELASIALETLSHAFPENRARVWMAEHWYFFVQCCLFYFVTIFSLKRFMAKREAFDLQLPLNAWNLFLALFSTGGMLFMAGDFFGTLFHYGFRASYCDMNGMMGGANGTWMFMFMLSKLAEFTDTYFIVLRKKPLMFLHWYHHILSLVYATFSYPDTPAFNRWGVYLNFCVHSVMYSYYFLRSIHIRIPGRIAKAITSMQILQFVISIFVLVCRSVELVSNDSRPCDFHYPSFWLACFMDTTYLVLFVNFFLHSYVLRGGKAKYAKVEEKKSE